MKKITIGSRGSKLALIYAERVKKEIQKFYKDHIEIKTIVTSGDKNQKDRLSDLGGKGLFSKNIDISSIGSWVSVDYLCELPSMKMQLIYLKYQLNIRKPYIR